MKIKSEEVLYNIVEENLGNADSPMTCADLMDIPEVRKAALKRFGSDLQTATNKLSDMLGFMWRRSVLERYQAPPSRSMARYAYKLAARPSVVSDEPLPPPVPLVGKQQFSISEQGGDIVIDFPSFSIRVTPK
jgi:hypothetical protein